MRIPILFRLPVLLAVSALACGATAGANEVQWRSVDPDNAALLQLTEGEVVIELNPSFAPKTVTQFKRLVRQGFYDGTTFYRVIDGFVAQAGDGGDMGDANAQPAIEAEFERDESSGMDFVSAQAPDLFAPETGFVDGFPAARDPDSGTTWLIHCPGAVAMARSDDPDSSNTEFYIVIGQAPRYLDRNLNVFGRVVHGMEVVQRLRRGPPSNNGIIDDPDSRSRISRVSMLADLPPEEQPPIEVIDTGADAFRTMLESRRVRDADFFFNKPPAVLDVCQVPNQGRSRAAGEAPPRGHRSGGM